jgi:large subunit ribosomal protein L25
MTYSLSATTRTTSGDRTREQGQIPAVLYGAGQDSQSVAVENAHFIKLYRAAGEASLIDLTVDGKDAGKALIQEVQLDPVKDHIIHVDLRRIDMTKPMTATVELKFVGEAPVVKASGGTLVTNFNTVEVRCLPKDLVSSIEVDISGLNSYDDTIKVKDIKRPEGVEITSPTENDLVAKAVPALSEEELKKMEEAGSAQADLSKIESAKKKKEDEDAAADGAEKKEEEKK